MSTETTNTAESGAGATAPAVTNPTNDAQAAQIEQQAAATPDPAKVEADKQAEDAKAGEERKRNRTKAYIDRINGENAEYRRRLAELEARTSAPAARTPQSTTAQADRGPQLEDFNFDSVAWQEARDAWVIEQASSRITQTTQKAEELRKQQETAASYQQQVDAFTDAHPDFSEVVGSIPPQFLTPELQAAIMAHERGAEIAYHIATDEDALFNLASIRPELQAAAVERLASRMGRATAAAAVTPPAAPPAAPQKPLTQAPPPAPQVSGRAVTETPSEKLTDDEWHDRERAKRKRG